MARLDKEPSGANDFYIFPFSFLKSEPMFWCTMTNYFWKFQVLATKPSRISDLCVRFFARFVQNNGTSQFTYNYFFLSKMEIWAHYIHSYVCWFCLNSLIQEETFNKNLFLKKKTNTHTHTANRLYSREWRVLFKYTNWIGREKTKQTEQTVPLYWQSFYSLVVSLCVWVSVWAMWNKSVINFKFTSRKKFSTNIFINSRALTSIKRNFSTVFYDYFGSTSWVVIVGLKNVEYEFTVGKACLPSKCTNVMTRKPDANYLANE